MATISLCMITKNEEFFLEQCLNSVKDLVDEIIILDTGSRDKTKEIASKFTSKIFDFKWCDDFSKARNESLKYATKEWILILDADESLSKEDHSKLKELLETTKSDGFFLIHRNYTNSSNAAGWISSNNDNYKESKVANGWYPEPIIRLFRNNKNIYFKGIVHESVYDSLIGNIPKTNIPIHHYGKLDKDKLKQKENYYEILGEKKVIENNNFYSFFELGRQYLHNNKLNKAIDAFEKSIELKRDYFESWFMLGCAYLLKEDFDNSLSKLRRAQALNHNYSPIYANLGIIFVKKNDFKKAIKNFLKAVTLNPNDASTFKNLGMCYEEIGEKEKANYAFKRFRELNMR